MGFLEDLKNGDIKSIILIILILLIFNLYWLKDNTKEPMSNISNDIKEAVKQVYLADVQAIRNLSEVASKLQRDNNLTLPGNLTVTGSFNYLPRGCIVAYNSNVAPNGWAICDGSNGTPNLTNRFILGSGSKSINSTGGAETVTLNINQIPAHNHTANVSDPGHEHHLIEGAGSGSGNWWGVNNGHGKAMPRTNKTTTGIRVGITNTGGSQAHENMPPFYVLTYIMKL